MERGSGLLCGGSTPVVGARNGNLCPVLDRGWDEHGFVARKDCLAPCHSFAGLVFDPDVACSVHAVGFLGEGLVNVTVMVAVEASILGDVKSIYHIPIGDRHTIDSG